MLALFVTKTCRKKYKTKNAATRNSLSVETSGSASKEFVLSRWQITLLLFFCGV
jgi:hypothetical protein